MDPAAASSASQLNVPFIHEPVEFQLTAMEELNACTQCGFTTTSMVAFTAHIEHHEEEQKASTADHSSQNEWGSGSSSGLYSSGGSPAGLVSDSEKTPSPPSLILDDYASSKDDAQSPPPVKSSKQMHVCPHCNFTTYMSQHMKSHLEAHERHQGQMYQCDICQMQFSQKANMHRHRMRHSGVKPYECRYCKKRFFRKDQMQEHSMTHIKTGADFDCPVANCPQLFSQHSQLRSHLDDTHSICPASPASCKRCSLLFANSRRLLLHYQTRHDDHDMTSPPSPSENSEVADIVPKKRRATDSPADILAMLKTNNDIKKEIKQEIREPVIPSQMYDLTSNQLIMSFLANNASFAYPALLAANKLQVNGLQLWPDSVPGAPLVTPHLPEEEAHSPSIDSGSSNVDPVEEIKPQMECTHCGITFQDQTIHLLHKGLHSDGDPWRCNLCGLQCGEKYMFSTHVIFANHAS